MFYQGRESVIEGEQHIPKIFLYELAKGLQKWTFEKVIIWEKNL